jgi:hypothetical protein
MFCINWYEHVIFSSAFKILKRALRLPCFTISSALKGPGNSLATPGLIYHVPLCSGVCTFGCTGGQMNKPNVGNTVCKIYTSTAAKEPGSPGMRLLLLDRLVWPQPLLYPHWTCPEIHLGHISTDPDPGLQMIQKLRDASWPKLQLVAPQIQSPRPPNPGFCSSRPCCLTCTSQPTLLQHQTPLW